MKNKDEYTLKIFGKEEGCWNNNGCNGNLIAFKIWHENSLSYKGDERADG